MSTSGGKQLKSSISLSSNVNIEIRQFGIDPQTYRDKVLGCWHGKNIGGTLGRYGNSTLYEQM